MKCYSQVGAFAAFNQLKERISAQINQSERILQRHFDPALKKPDRPDRLLKSRELAQILRFYLERSLRYGIFEETAAHEARGLLESIEQGYSLQFRRCALIFDFDKSGTESPDNEVGIEFHRIGKDLIHALLENCRKPVSVESEEVPTAPTLSEQFISNVPKLETAAFIAPNRVRSTSGTMSWRHQSHCQHLLSQRKPSHLFKRKHRRNPSSKHLNLPPLCPSKKKMTNNPPPLMWNRKKLFNPSLKCRSI